MKGIVYKIIYKEKTMYIGSTINYSRRKSEHKSKCYNENSNEYNKDLYVFIRDNCKWEDLIFEIIKEIEVETRKELTKIEGDFIKEHKNTCLNIFIAGRTKQEYEKERQYTEKRIEQRKRIEQSEKRKEYKRLWNINKRS